MRRILVLMLAEVLVATQGLTAASPAPSAQQHVDAFLSGDFQKVLDHASPELRALAKDPTTLKAIRTGTVGDTPELVDEQLIASYVRRVKSADGQVWTISATVDGKGQLIGFLVNRAGEAPSKHLDYKTKANMRLPFNEAWTVFWGGRTLKENYHVVAPDQRFAYDIVIMKDGKSHSGEGKQNSDYYCFGKELVSPSAATVISVVDGLPDNKPGEMDPANAPGNCVILDFGNSEYMLLAHLRSGSVKVKAGDKVAAGDVLGLCGNSGNTSEPHLHIHLQTEPRFGSGVGLPLQFQNYEADGKPVDRGEPVKGQVIKHQG